ncbi:MULTISPECIES: ZIP family zinc transporter [unclassified Arthrobacter]|uniref:ZIP family metal transporter n=3 Tax=Micrococcaceae TaxID=1268 RepID=UPI0026C944A0|nr:MULTISPECIES: ZIP family zinc transporter [unclassified Arthrobacter]
MSMAWWALIWGLVSGASLLLGAAAGWWLKLPRAAVAGIMAFGAGVLICALAFELVAESYATGGLLVTALGLICGALLYFFANRIVAKRSRAPGSASASGNALAVGALIDGIPESVALGVGLVAGGAVNPAMLVAIFISNIPEALASTAQQKQAGKKAGGIFLLWGSVTLVAGVASWAGFALLSLTDPGWTAFAIALAAGGILTMVADTMIPEAWAVEHDFTGLIATAGFLTAFAVHAVG